MNEATDYLQVNKAAWNAKTTLHVKSDFYNQEAFLNGETSLKGIEMDLLADIQDKTILHLQCHFGQDTLSLARMGARATGVDLSDIAIEQAKAISKQINTQANFICSDIYELPNQLDQQFDIVFTSYGTIGWLPDLDKWANIVSRYLKPGGKFIFVDFHPVVWMFDNDFKEVAYNYFNDGPIVEEEQGTYADKSADIVLKTVGWNHSISEILNSLLHQGLELNSFDEFDYSPYNCLNQMVELESGKFTIKHLGTKIPMVFALVATKRR